MADLFSIFVPLKSGGENRMRRLIFGTVIGSLVAVAAVAAAIFYYERPNVLRIAVPRDSDDQAIMAAAAHDFAEARDGIRLKLVAVESLAESSRALQEGHADLAVVRSDRAMPPNGQTVLIMRRDAALLFAPAESSLRAIDDLHGHKVGVLQAAPPGKVDNQLLLDTALAQYDVPSASVGRVSLTLAELSRAVENKEIDAVLAVGVPGSDGLTEAGRRIDPAFAGGAACHRRADSDREPHRNASRRQGRGSPRASWRPRFSR